MNPHCLLVSIHQSILQPLLVALPLGLAAGQRCGQEHCAGCAGFAWVYASQSRKHRAVTKLFIDEQDLYFEKKIGGAPHRIGRDNNKKTGNV